MPGFDEEYRKNNGQLFFSRVELASGDAHGEILYRTNLPFIGITVERLWGRPVNSSTNVPLVGKAVTIDAGNLLCDGFGGLVQSVVGNDADVVLCMSSKTVRVPESALRLSDFGIQQSAPTAMLFSQDTLREGFPDYLRARCLAITHPEQVSVVFAYLQEHDLGAEIRDIVLENVLENRLYTNMRNDVSVRTLAHWATGTNHRNHFDIIDLCPALDQVTLNIDYSIFWSIDARGVATLDSVTAIVFKLNLHLFLCRGNMRKLRLTGLNYNQTRRMYPAQVMLLRRDALETLRDALEAWLVQNNPLSLVIEIFTGRGKHNGS